MITGIRIKLGMCKKNLVNTIRILVVICFFLLAVWAITLEHYNLLMGQSGFARWCTTALKNIGPELAGIVIGIVIIDYLNEQRQNDQLKNQLKLQMGSQHRDVSDTAVRTLHSYGWLTDGSLKRAYLAVANLEGADLKDANLEEVNLNVANLKKAHLDGANLRKARLNTAELQGAYLNNADLEGANLRGAKLQGAKLQKAILRNVDDLCDAILEGADLSCADLSGAKGYTIEQLLQAKSLKNAIMPDGTEFIEDKFDKSK